jgi:DNA invertase Pin-like site-specific DNA recombinase
MSTESRQNGTGGAPSAADTAPPKVRPSHRNKLAVIYARQSSAEQVRENTGSTTDQLALADIPRRWGWPEDRILVIDDDLGLSGTSCHDRPGFMRMLDLISRGEVGLVVVREVSRLSRDPADAAMFLRKASRGGVLLYASGHLFDLPNETLAQMFGLHIQTLCSWWENGTRVATARAAAIARAREGHAVTRCPIGYVPAAAARGQWAKDPLLEVQQAVQRIFDLYLQLGSIGKVLSYLHRNGLLFPHRTRGEVRWEPTSRSHIDNILRNQHYTGDYVFQRRKYMPKVDGRKAQSRPRPRSEWIVIPSHHEAYVSPETFQRIQESLEANRPAVRPPLGRGSASLQGLVWCKQCERLMSTTYQGREGAIRYPSYRCRLRDRADKPIHRAVYPAKLIDRQVVTRVLQVLNPAEMQIAVQAIEEHQVEQSAIAKANSQRLQRAEDDITALRRRHALIDVKHKRVLADVEEQLERALELFHQLKAQFAAALPLPTLTRQDAADLMRLTAKIDELWAAATNEDRKRLLRALITRVIVGEKADDAIELEIVWAGGGTERLRVLRPDGVAKLVRALSDAGKNSRGITEDLQRMGMTNRDGRIMSRLNVRQTLRRIGGANGTRILGLINQRREAGDSYPAIADWLNASGISPMRAAAFSAALVQALLHQSRVRAAKAQRQSDRT